MWKRDLIYHTNYAEIIYTFSNFKGAAVNGWRVISSYTLLDSWLLIDAGVENNMHE